MTHTPFSADILPFDSVVAYGTEKIEGKWSYQSLIVLQFAFVAAIFFPWFWFPESPYWLLKRGQEESARKSLRRIQGGSDHDFLDIELARFKEMMATSDQLAKEADLRGPPLIQAFKGGNLVRPVEVRPRYVS